MVVQQYYVRSQCHKPHSGNSLQRNSREQLPQPKPFVNQVLANFCQFRYPDDPTVGVDLGVGEGGIGRGGDWERRRLGEGEIGRDWEGLENLPSHLFFLITPLGGGRGGFLLGGDRGFLLGGDRGFLPGQTNSIHRFQLGDISR